jgi:heme exporter protein B
MTRVLRWLGALALAVRLSLDVTFLVSSESGAPMAEWLATLRLSALVVALLLCPFWVVEVWRFMGREVYLLLKKDLLIEWRTKARLNALVFFSLATLLMFSFALGADSAALRKNSAGYYWLAILLASVLALAESFRVEMENGAMDGLKLAPTDPRAIFLGKALANTLLLFALSVVITPVSVALYDVSIRGAGTFGQTSWELLKLFGVSLMGSLGIAAPGTIYSAISSNARARDVLLPLLLFPVLLPSLLASVRATGFIFDGDPMNQLPSWVFVQAAFILVYWGLGFALFPKVVEDD